MRTCTVRMDQLSALLPPTPRALPGDIPSHPSTPNPHPRGSRAPASPPSHTPPSPQGTVTQTAGPGRPHAAAYVKRDRPVADLVHELHATRIYT
eukprot:scaffold15759_cov112-Isochrysis_galbana.AAC.8